jgi:hypothetical protein
MPGTKKANDALCRRIPSASNRNGVKQDWIPFYWTKTMDRTVINLADSLCFYWFVKRLVIVKVLILWQQLGSIGSFSFFEHSAGVHVAGTTNSR